MSVGEKRVKTSSAVSGSSQNYPNTLAWTLFLMRLSISAYTSPILVVCGNGLLLREAEDALLEDEFGIRGTHGVCSVMEEW